jgi:pimeloyl-ACP methyl ester carboxylesterase
VSGQLAVSFDVLHGIAAELRAGAARVAALGPGLLRDLSAPELGLLPLPGLPGGPGLVAEIGSCCGPLGLPTAAAELAALGLRVRAAGLAYAAVEDAVAATLGATMWPLAGPLATTADDVAGPLQALALLVAWDAEHRLAPPGGRRLTDPVLDLLDLSIEGAAAVDYVDPAALRAGGVEPSALLPAGESAVGALRAVAALSQPGLPSTFAVARVGAGPPPRFVVCLPGLQRWWGADAGAADLPGAMATLTGHSSYVAGVRRQLASLPAGSEVLLVGHSQGGMVAQALAADRGLRAAGVVVAGALTAGAPRLADAPLPAVSYLALENDGDPVPPLRRLVAGVLLPAIPQPAHAGTVVVRFPATCQGHGLANHGLVSGGYLDEAASSDPRVVAWRRQMARFFSGHVTEVRAYRVTDGGPP